MNGPDSLSLLDAMKFLGAGIGGGGLTAILVAWLGYRKESQKTEASVPNTMLGAALYADRLAVERFSGSLDRLSGSIERLVERGGDIASDIRSEIRELREGIESMNRKRR